MRRKVPFLVGEFYHIYNRGTDKRIIFNNDHDYKRFMLLLYLCNSVTPVHTSNLFNKGLTFIELFSIEREEILVDITGFCLMPNHFHILLYEKIEGGTSKFMQKLLTAYTMYFNAVNDRTGSLFESAFKAKNINTEAYLNWVFSYIHLNPVKLISPNWKEEGIVNIEAVESFMENYKYSSYHDYFINDSRIEGVILNKDTSPDHFSELNDFEDIAKEFKNKGQTFI